MGNKSRKPKHSQEGKKWKKGVGRDALAPGKQPRASGNMPNVASRMSSLGNNLRKTTLAFIGAVTRTSRGRKALIDAIARQQEAARQAAGASE